MIIARFSGPPWWKIQRLRAEGGNHESIHTMHHLPATAWGIFRVPLGTGTIRFFMNQAERKNVPQNGSAARFDDLGLYLFDTQEEAAAFVNKYKDQKP